jgi:signal peptidase I
MKVAENNFENENLELVKETSGEFNILKEVWEWFYTIFLALVIAFGIKMFLVDIVRVDGPSMYPTLVNNDRLFVTKIGYKPESGDIIILDSAYKNRMEYYDQYEEMNDTELSTFSKFRMYFKLPQELKRKYYIKRIIGMPGDVIDLKDGNVIVNGNILNEPYYDGVTGITDPYTEYPFTVSENCVFVMGDNRPNSKDSRSTSLGEVPFGAIGGHAIFRLWPITSFGVLR